MKIAICDDERAVAEQVLSLVERYRQSHPALDLEARLFSGPDSLFSALDQGAAFDIYLLDILMPGRDGLSIARELRARGSRSVIIFLTSSPDYSLEAFGVRAMQYLLKPVSEQAFFTTLEEAACALPREASGVLPLSTPDGLMRISYSSIAFIECARRVLQVHLTEGKLVHSRTVRGSFLSAIQPLMADARFVLPHQSFLVNMFQVARLSAREFTMLDGSIVPVSKNRLAQVKGRYLAFLSSIDADH